MSTVDQLQQLKYTHDQNVVSGYDFFLLFDDVSLQVLKFDAHYFFNVNIELLDEIKYFFSLFYFVHKCPLLLVPQSSERRAVK